MKNGLQKFGKFLSAMVMPNIGAFIAWPDCRRTGKKVLQRRPEGCRDNSGSRIGGNHEETRKTQPRPHFQLRR